MIATFREIAPACFFHRGIASPRPSDFFPRDKLFASLIVDNPGYPIWSELIERVATMGNGALVSKDGDGSSAKCQFPLVRTLIQRLLLSNVPHGIAWPT